MPFVFEKEPAQTEQPRYVFEPKPSLLERAKSALPSMPDVAGNFRRFGDTLKSDFGAFQNKPADKDYQQRAAEFRESVKSGKPLPNPEKALFPDDNPGFLSNAGKALRSGVEDVGRSVIGAYESLDPAREPTTTKTGASLLHGVEPLLGIVGVTPPAMGGTMVGETVRSGLESAGASPDVQAALGLMANVAVPGKFIPNVVRGVSPTISPARQAAIDVGKARARASRGDSAFVDALRDQSPETKPAVYDTTQGRFVAPGDKPSPRYVFEKPANQRGLVLDPEPREAGNPTPRVRTDEPWGTRTTLTRGPNAGVEILIPGEKAVPNATPKSQAVQAPASEVVPPVVEAVKGEASPVLTAPENIEVRAHEAATSPLNDLPEPTRAQKEAGNYKKGHVSWNGLDVTIENPAGSTRSGVDPNGEPWSVEMPAHYGYLKRTKGADGDQVDIYLGKTPGDKVFVVDQIDTKTGKFDEHKLIGNVGSLDEAKALYDAGFSDNLGPQRRSVITEMTLPELKEWLDKGNTAKPLAESASLNQNPKPTAEMSMDELLAAAEGKPATPTEPTPQVVPPTPEVAPKPTPREAAKAKAAERVAKAKGSTNRPIWADELESIGGKINPDGTVDLYHATTKEKAAQIQKTGILKRPADAPDSYGVYFSSSPDVAADYGDGTIVKVRVKASDLKPDDSFPGRRLDFTTSTRNGIYKPVKIEPAEPTPAVAKAKPDKPVETQESKLSAEEIAARDEMRGMLGGERVKIIKTPKPKPAPNENQSFTAFLKGLGGVSIGKSPKEAGELRGLREGARDKAIVRVGTKDGVSINKAAELAHEAGFIDDLSAESLIRAIEKESKGERVISSMSDKSDRKIDLQAERDLRKADQYEADLAARKHVESITDTPTELEYQGHPYEGAEKLPGGKVKLKDDPDKILESPDEILKVEEKVPFDIPEEPKFEQTPAGKQAIIPGGKVVTPVVPDAPLRSKRAQNESPLELEQPGIRAKEPGLFDPKVEEPSANYNRNQTDKENRLSRMVDKDAALRAKEALGNGDIPDATYLSNEELLSLAKVYPEYREVAQHAGLISEAIRKGRDPYLDMLLEGVPFAGPDIQAEAARILEAGMRKPKPSSNPSDLSGEKLPGLIKKALGTEKGTIGKLTPEEAAAEATAREARREIYRRIAERASQTGESIESAAEKLKVPPALLTKLKTELQEQPPAPPATAPTVGEPPEGGFVTSIKNAQVDKELAEMGLPPATHGEHVSFEAAREQAARAMQSDPFAGRKLVDQLVGNPRPVTYFEDALLLHEQVRLKNERTAAESALISAQKSGDPIAIKEAKARVDGVTADYATLADVDAQAGTASSLSLGHRRMRMKEDYSLAAMERAKQVANEGKPLTDEQRAEVKTLYDKINATQKAFDDYVAGAEKRKAEMESELAHTRLLAEAKESPTVEIEPHIKSLAERIVSSMESQAESARARLKSKLSSLHAGIDPTILSDLVVIGSAKLARKTMDIAQWSKAMIDDLGEKISPYLKDVWDASNKALDDRIDRMAGKSSEPVKRVIKKADIAEQKAAAKEQIKTKIKEEGGAADISRQAQALARMFVEQGVSERNALIDAVHAELKEVSPDMTRRQAMDAISGYGKYSQLSKEQIASELRDLKGQMQQVAKLEDIQNRKPPLKTGVERRAISDEERHLIQQVNEAKRRFGITITDPETQLKSALGARKTYYENAISDLEAQIESKEKFVKTKTPSPTDADLVKLKARHAELKSEFDDVFGKPGLTDEQRIAAATKGLEKSIADLDERIKTGDIAPHSQVKPISTPALEGLRSRRDALQAKIQSMRDGNPKLQEEKALKSLNQSIEALQTRLAKGDIAPKPKPAEMHTPALDAARSMRDSLQDKLDELRDLANPKKTPEERALQSLKTRLKRDMDKMTEQLATGDFSKPQRREIKLDKEAQTLSFEAAKIKQKWHEALMNDRLRNRTAPQKVIGTTGEVLNTSRAVLTSFDLSAVFRQGAAITFPHPIRAARIFPDMFKALISEKGAHAVNQEILRRDNYPLYARSKLYLSEHASPLSQMEEAYMSRWADKIPGVAASQRAYTTFLNKLRADSFDAMAKSLTREGNPTPEESRAIANFINVATGRGDFGANANAMVGLNTVFFAPRFVASRFQLLLGQPLYKGTAATRTLVAKEYARMLAGIGMVYGLSSIAGAEIEVDPRSSDFGKIRIGNTRVDPMAGLSQVTVLLGRLASGETKSIRGRVTPIRGDKKPYGGSDSADVVGRFLRSKLSPWSGTALNMLSGKNVIGEPVTPEQIAQGLVVPLAFQDIYDAMKEQGAPAGAALGILGTFGMSLQTFDAKKKRVNDRRTFAERWGFDQDMRGTAVNE